MNKALVKTLEGSVNNPNLPYYGEINFTVTNNSSTPYIGVNSTGTITAEILDDDFSFAGGGKTKNITGSGTIQFPVTNRSYKACIYSKYDITVFDVDYASRFIFNGLQLKSMFNLTKFELKGGAQHSNIKELIENIMAVAGNLNSIAVANTSVSNLTLEKIAEIRVAAFPNSGVLNTYFYNTGIQFNNAALTNNNYYLHFSGGNITISSDAAGTSVLATYNGSTWTYA